MALLKCILVLALAETSMTALPVPCTDIDSAACTKMAETRPDLCSDMSLSTTACPAYCNLCPTSTTTVVSATSTTPMTTTTALPVVTSPPCEDIDTSACHLMAQNRPDLCSDATLANSACKRFCKLCPRTCYHCEGPVNDYHQCQTTKQCQVGELCMVKTVRSFLDNHMEYEMTCETKQKCDGGDLSVVFGRRGLQARDLSVSCCAEDLCNYPEARTTTTTKPVCRKDVIFMIVGSVNLYHYSNDVKNFLSGVINDLDIDHQDASLVSMATYSTSVNKEWDLDSHMTKNELIAAVGKLDIPRSRPDLTDALQFVDQYATTRRAGDRPDADDVVVFLTARGHSTHTSAQIIDLTNAMHRISNDVIRIVVGGDAIGDHLATDARHRLHVRNPHQLSSLRQQVLQLICE